MEKTLTFLNSGLSDKTNIKQIIDKAIDSQNVKNISCKFFDLTFFKKGTCHIVFTNEELLKKLNVFGSQYKNWLPPSYGTQTYDNMESEEQLVIESFEGQDEYQKTMQQKSYYITEKNSF